MSASPIPIAVVTTPVCGGSLSRSSARHSAASDTIFEVSV